MGKWNSIFYGALLLTGANLLLRLVTMTFQVYLSGRIGAAGIGLLQLILSVRELSFAVGSAGIRTCAMYLSAEELGRGRPQGLHGVLSGCFRYSLVFSSLAAVCLWTCAPWLSEVWIGDRSAISSLRVCALFLPIRCLGGVMTGYFTSMGRIRDMVLVEFLEQGCSMAVTFFLLSRWSGADAGRACLSVILGGCAASLLALWAFLSLHRRKLPPRAAKRATPYRRISRIALPLGVADGLRSGLNAIENLITPKRLALYAGTVNAMADYGVVCGMVFPVLMFPVAILVSLADLLVPEFSRCAAGQRQTRVRYLTRRGLRVALLFGLCSGGVLYAGAETLGQLLYHDATVGVYLRLYAPFVPMLYMDAIVDAICKGLGQQNASARYNVLTSFLDVAILWLLLPRLGLGGYYFSFAITHLINFCLSLRRLILVSGVHLRIGPALRAILCAAAAGEITTLLSGREGVMGVLFPGGCYLLLLSLFWALLGIVGKEDLLWVQGLMHSQRSHVHHTVRR